MNAQRRLEEFIFKLSTTQHNQAQQDFINELKVKIALDNKKINQSKGSEKRI